MAIFCGHLAVKRDHYFTSYCQNGVFKRKKLNVLVKLEEHECKVPHIHSAAKVANSVELCGANAERYKIGFKIPTVDNSFLTFVETCYDPTTQSAVMSSHKLFGNRCKNGKCSGDFKAKLTANPDASQVTDVNSCYSVDSQKTRLPSVVKDDKTKFFSKGQLTPAADGLNSNFAKASNYYLNVVPQWTVIKDGNWLKVEEAAREIADAYGYTEVHTGTIGSINYDDKKSLCDSGINIPSWVYKVVKVDDVVDGKNVEKGIAFVTSNKATMTAEELASAKAPCTDVCDSLGLLQDDKQRSDFQKGYTICCEIKDLKKKVSLPINAEQIVTLRNQQKDAKDLKRCTAKFCRNEK